MARRRPSKRDHVIDAGWRFGSCLGLAAGLLVAMGTRPGTPASCAEPVDPASPFAGCISDSVVAQATPYVLGMGLGMLLGAVLGALVARFVWTGGALLVMRARTARGSVAPAAIATTHAGPAGRTMVARYSSPCAMCTTPIVPGSLIEHRGPKQTLCASCAWPAG